MEETEPKEPIENMDMYSIVRPGDRIEIYDDIDVDSEYGMSASLIIEGIVQPRSSDTFLNGEDVSLEKTEFYSTVSKADGYQIIRGKHLPE